MCCHSKGAGQFSLDKVKDVVKTTQAVEVPTFQTFHIQGLSCVRGHDKRVNAMIDAPMKLYSKQLLQFQDIVTCINTQKK